VKRTLFALAAALLVAGAVFLVLNMNDPVAPDTVAPAEAIAVPVPTAPLAVAPPAADLAEFQKKLDSTQDALPSSEKIETLPSEEVHNTPQLLIDASFQIGELAEAIAKNPALGAQGMDFYGKCARRGELAISVRAHCLHNMRELSKKQNQPASEAGISESVQKLEGPALK
jgi:hypothetical protein